MTRPCRRITLHLSQIFLTLGLTFIGFLQDVLAALRASLTPLPVFDHLYR